MAFTGVAVIKMVSDRLVRITGLSIANGANGTIGLHEKTVAPDERLPAAFQPRRYEDSSSPVALQDSIKVWFAYTDPGAVVMPVGVVKAGTTPEDFVATLSNAGAADSGELEIWVEFH